MESLLVQSSTQPLFELANVNVNVNVNDIQFDIQHLL